MSDREINLLHAGWKVREEELLTRIQELEALAREMGGYIKAWADIPNPDIRATNLYAKYTALLGGEGK